ncbi:MAG: cytochrome C oxidase subunit IV family protein [Planctomycetaceae bacterium]|nr:cytochrome C oxidase subunit IV family protein [Planctomycetaceae bacterium]
MSHDQHDSHHVNYLYVFIALCGFTGLSVIFDIVHMSRPVTIVLVLAVATAKAMCVMMFFMHLKFEGNWKYVLLVPTTILAIGLPFALLPDIGASYYTSLAPQKQAWGEEVRADHGEHHDEEAGHSEPAE